MVFFRCEFSLIDYITKIGNFNESYIQTGLFSAGNFDMWNIGTSDIVASTEIKALVEQKRSTLSDYSEEDTTIPFEFLLNPCSGILNCPTPLAPGLELKLSFDRAKAEHALINKSVGVTAELGAVVKLKGLYLKAKYFSSAYLRNIYTSIDDNPLKYNYDECSCYLKNLPQSESNIRLDNILGGLTPKYIFAGIIKSDALNGSYNLSAGRFERYNVKEFDLTLNGTSCSGFPIVNTNGSAMGVYNKWLQSTNRFFNNKCGAQIPPLDFKRFHFLYSHKFEGEPTEQGWLGIDLKLESAYEENYTLGTYKALCNFIL